jgi:hypothetical protein
MDGKRACGIVRMVVAQKHREERFLTSETPFGMTVIICKTKESEWRRDRYWWD